MSDISFRNPKNISTIYRIEIKKDTEDEELAKEFYQYFCDLSKIDIETLGELNGALRQVEFSK